VHEETGRKRRLFELVIRVLNISKQDPILQLSLLKLSAETGTEIVSLLAIEEQKLYILPTKQPQQLLFVDWQIQFL